MGTAVKSERTPPAPTQPNTLPTPGVPPLNNVCQLLGPKYVTSPDGPQPPRQMGPRSEGASSLVSLISGLT